MDALTLKSSFIRNMVSKIMQKTLKSKFGYLVDIQLNDFQIVSDENGARIHINAEANVEKEEFKKIVKDLLKD